MPRGGFRLRKWCHDPFVDVGVVDAAKDLFARPEHFQVRQVLLRHHRRVDKLGWRDLDVKCPAVSTDHEACIMIVVSGAGDVVFDLISWRDSHFEGQCVSQKLKTRRSRRKERRFI